MQLAVDQFYNYQPASQWAFEVNFSNPMMLSKKVSNGKKYQYVSTNTFTEQDLERISQSVVSVTQPKFDIQPFTTCYGNFDFVVPMYDVNNIELKIAFEDTDDCLISYKFISSLLGGSTLSNVPAWLNIHETILITITQYDSYTYDAERPNTKAYQYKNYNTTTVKSYFCKLKEYTEPAYSRTSDDPQATNLTLTFLAVPAYPTVLDDRMILTNGVEQVDVLAQAKEILNAVKKLWKDFKFTVSTAVGYMTQQTIRLKDVYDSLLESYGGTLPANFTLADLENWYKTHALANAPQGQCSRGPGLLFQLADYIRTGQAEQEQLTGEACVTYVLQGKADQFAQGTGTSEEFKSHIKSAIEKFNTTGLLNLEEMNTELTKLQNGQYVTFSYERYNEQTGKYEQSQHIVFKSYDNDDHWSDFLQKTASGITGNVRNFKITGAYSVDNIVLNTQQNTTNTAPGAATRPTDPVFKLGYRSGIL